MFKGTDPIFGVTNDLFSRGCLTRMWTFALLVSTTSHKYYYYNVKYEHACCIITPFPFYRTYFFVECSRIKTRQKHIILADLSFETSLSPRIHDVHLLLIKCAVAKLITRHVKVRIYSPCTSLSVHHVNKCFT